MRLVNRLHLQCYAMQVLHLGTPERYLISAIQTEACGSRKQFQIITVFERCVIPVYATGTHARTLRVTSHVVELSRWV